MKHPAFLSLAFFLAVSTMVACNKDDDNDKPQTVFTKNNLAMSGDQEFPTNTSTGTGSMNVSYDKSTKLLVLSATWQNLSGEPTGAHIHGPAARGKNAGVKVDLHDLVTAVSGNFSHTVTVDEVSIKEDSLLAGFYYFNIHTANNPGGEIRGQIEF